MTNNEKYMNGDDMVLSYGGNSNIIQSGGYNINSILNFNVNEKLQNLGNIIGEKINLENFGMPSGLSLFNDKNNQFGGNNNDFQLNVQEGGNVSDDLYNKLVNLSNLSEKNEEEYKEYKENKKSNKPNKPKKTKKKNNKKSKNTRKKNK